VPDVPQGPCTREKVTVLVKRDGHHSVGQIKGLFDSVAVVDVDVDVQHALQRSISMYAENYGQNVESVIMILNGFKFHK
jgi:hypothetical protein